jgi:hypothetical protein
MKTMLCLLILGFVTLLGGVGIARADVYQGAPIQAVLLPADGSGIANVAFLFDLSSLRAGDNRHIEEALLDWRVTGLPEEGLPEFVVYPITSPWTQASVLGGAAPSVQQERVSDWQINPLAPENADGKLVRLDLTELAGSWAAGTKANYGVIVAVPGISSKVLGDQLAKAQLTIRYGFRDN